MKDERFKKKKNLLLSINNINLVKINGRETSMLSKLHWIFEFQVSIWIHKIMNLWIEVAFSREKNLTQMSLLE